jgi:ATP-binding cassette, subfamily B (MDR/TAP), member 1
MQMDIAYFDMPTHSSAKISTRLATDTPNVKAAIDFRLGSVISAIISVLCGVGLAFYYEWKLALLLVAIFPLFGIGEGIKIAYLTSVSKKSFKEFESAGKVALEAVENIRTVQALTLERKFYRIFCEHLEKTRKSSTMKAFTQSLTYGFSMSILHFLVATTFRFALYLIENHEMDDPMNTMRVLFGMYFSISSASFASSYFSAYSKTKLAAGTLFRMTK